VIRVGKSSAWLTASRRLPAIVFAQAGCPPDMGHQFSFILGSTNPYTKSVTKLIRIANAE
jgi:hypothetical protein